MVSTTGNERSRMEVEVTSELRNQSVSRNHVISGSSQSYALIYPPQRSCGTFGTPSLHCTSVHATHRTRPLIVHIYVSGLIVSNEAEVK